MGTGRRFGLQSCSKASAVLRSSDLARGGGSPFRSEEGLPQAAAFAFSPWHKDSHKCFLPWRCREILLPFVCSCLDLPLLSEFASFAHVGSRRVSQVGGEPLFPARAFERCCSPQKLAKNAACGWSVCRALPGAVRLFWAGE